MPDIPQSRLRHLRILRPGPREAEFFANDSKQSQSLIDLASNDYLGLSRHPVVIQAAQESSSQEGVGAGGSRFVTGSRLIHQSLESALSDWLGREKVFLFPSGFQANIAAVMALANRQTPIIADRLCHYSLLVGIKASGAKLHRFAHNSCEDLERCLQRCTKRDPKSKPLVVTESLFSMQGTSPDLKKMTCLCDQYGAKMLVDEAHALGIMGLKGKGLSHAIEDPLVMISGTFGKAFGSGGAFLATNTLIGEQLLQTSGGFRYTTALAPPLASAALASLSLIKANSHWGIELLKQAKIWRIKLRENGWEIPNGEGPILPILMGSDETTLYQQKQLERKGLLSAAIRPPTVPEGSSRLRLVIRKKLPDQTLEKVIKALKEK